MKIYYVIVACALLLPPAPVWAGVIVGIGDAGPPFTGTTFFAVDPITGGTTPFGHFVSSQFYAVSSSPIDRTFFALSVNVYRINPFTSEFVGYLCEVAEDCTYSGHDLAYDPSNQTTYAVRNVPNDELLAQMVDRGPLFGSSHPGYHRVSYEPIGLMGVADINLIEYIQGLGLYGVSSSAGYLIDKTTGHASLLAPLTGIFMPITGMAYSFETGRLLASGGGPFGPETGTIYQLDPLTGRATLLNPLAANLDGIAYTTTIPETQPTWMITGGLAIWFTLRRRLCSVR